MSAELIKQLRERTGAGIVDCKKALGASNNDIEAAIDWLRKSGLAKAAKKSGRAATEGAVFAYIHGGGRIGVLVEINCETDFAAGTEGFKGLCRDIALQIAAAGAEWVNVSDVPADAVARERDVVVARTIAEGKPAELLKMKAFQYDIVCNGIELSSGAIRNHRPDIMIRAFEIAGYPAEEVEHRFGGMLNAFRYGAPPHGGSAPGIDRIVMLIADEPAIREVILFPMNQQAEDLMMGAPARVPPERLKELHIKLDLPPVKGSKPG